MTPQVINTLTNVVAFILFLGGALQTYFTSQPFNWLTFGMTTLGAVTAWFTGKSTLSQNK